MKENGLQSLATVTRLAARSLLNTPLSFDVSIITDKNLPGSSLLFFFFFPFYFSYVRLESVTNIHRMPRRDDFKPRSATTICFEGNELVER